MYIYLILFANCAFALLMGGCGATAAAGGSSAATDAVQAGDVPGTADVASNADAGGDASSADNSPAPDAPVADDASCTPIAAITVDVSDQPVVNMPTKSGKYAVQLQGPTKLKGGQPASYIATIADESGAAAVGLGFKIAFIHSTMGHGGSKVPKFTEIGCGVYQIDNIVPSMGGVWWLQAKIGADMAQFNIQVG